jgi:hypothetical protein
MEWGLLGSSAEYWRLFLHQWEGQVSFSGVRFKGQHSGLTGVLRSFIEGRPATYAVARNGQIPYCIFPLPMNLAYAV